MKEHSEKLGDKALEMIMRDVLDGLEDFSSVVNYSPKPCDFNIIQLEEHIDETDIHNTQRKKRKGTRGRSADIVSYIEKREQLMALKMKLSA